MKFIPPFTIIISLVWLGTIAPSLVSSKNDFLVICGILSIFIVIMLIVNSIADIYKQTKKELDEKLKE